MRPGVSFTISKLSQFFTNPTTFHWQALQWILRYVFGSPFSGLLLRATTSTTVTVFSDADWARDARTDEAMEDSSSPTEVT